MNLPGRAPSEFGVAGRLPTILHVFPTFVIGGSQRRFAQIATATRGQFRHIVFATDGRYEARVLVGGELETLPPIESRGNLLQRVSRYRRVLREIRPSLLITHNWGAIEWAAAGRLERLARIHIEDGFGPDEARRQLARRVWFRRLILPGSRAVVVPSRTLEMIARNVWRLPARAVRYLPNGIDTASREASPVPRLSLGVPDDAVVIAWVGALRPEKNLARLLGAFAALPGGAWLVLVGDGPERTRVEEGVRALGLSGRVRLLGERTDVPSVLQACDVLALSSDTEQMPMVVLEAMRAGLPIASVDVGDVALMVAPENRPFIAGRSAEQLGRSLRALLEAPGMAARVGRANSEHLRAAFPLDKMINAYVELYRAALSAHAVPLIK